MTGRSYSVLVRVGPSFGRMVVTVAGVRRVVNLHATRNGERLVHVYGGASTPLRTRRVTVTAGAGSKRIDIDGIRAVR